MIPWRSRAVSWRRNSAAAALAALLLSACATGLREEGPGGIGAVLFGKLPMTPVLSLQPGAQGSMALAWDVHPGAIYVRKLSPQGSRQWTWTLDEGAPEGRERDFPKLSRAGGGWYVAWMSNSSAGRAWEVQLLSENGEPRWPEAAKVADIASEGSELQACTASDGSLVLAWTDVDKSTNSRFIGVADILDTGLVAWRRELGRALANGWYSAPVLAPDESGGVFLAYRQIGPVADRGVMLQHYSIDGDPVWPDGLDIYDVGGYKTPAAMAPDGAGGVILFWEDGREASMKIYAQRVSPEEGPLWRSEGIAVAYSPGNQWSPLVAPDGLGGAYAAWLDDNRGGFSQLKLQHLGSEGKPSLGPAGLVAAPTQERQFKPVMIQDGSNGAFLGWLENGHGQYQLLAQHFDLYGTRDWDEAGAALVDTPALKEGLQIVADGEGGLVFAWRSLSSGSWDVRAARLDGASKRVW